MSDLTKCNYCSLRDMRYRAAKRGATVVLDREDGCTTARYSDEDKVAARFMELPERCVC